jgi:hypothetical protein
LVYNLTQTDRVVINPCGGFDWQTADIDKSTKMIRTSPKSGNEIWNFHEHHPTLERLLESYVMSTAAVLDDTLVSAYAIMATIRTEYAAVKAIVGPLSAEIDSLAKKCAKLEAQAKAKGKKDAE